MDVRWVCGRARAAVATVLALQKQLRELKEGRREMEEEANKLTREIHDLTERSAVSVPSSLSRTRPLSCRPVLVQMWAG